MWGSEMILLLFALILSLAIANPVLARTTLTASDLQYVGAFAMPWTGVNGGTQYGNGLALRRVGGEVRLFSTAFRSGTPNNYPLYETVVPSLRTSKPWNFATVLTNYGDVFTDTTGVLNGLYWDETDQRLYYSSGNMYLASGDPYAPSLGFLTFSGTTATPHGLWGFSNRSVKQVNYGVTAVPSDFATQYLGGKRLAAGFGGNQSVAGFGPISLGPSLTAFSPPVEGTAGTYLPNTPLVGYGGSHGSWTSGSRPAVDRAWRDDDVVQDVYGNLYDPDNSASQGVSSYWHMTGDELFYWQGYSINGSSRASYPDNITFPDTAIKTKHWVPGNAFWNTDYLAQSGTWIQTTNKEGLLLLGTFSTGHAWYWNSTPIAEGFKHKWLIYSRDQLASVAQGKVIESQIQAARYDTDIPDRTGIVSSGFGGTPPYTCTGMVFDPVDNKLYVALQYASNAPTVNSSSFTLVVVYQISDTASPGSCGSSNGLALASAPVSGLCSAGTASAVSGTGPWSWTCAGSGGGSTASCGATLLEVPPAGGASAVVACPVIAGFR